MPVNEVEHLQQNDVGTVFYMVVNGEDGNPVNLTGASTLQMKILKPGASSSETKTAAIHDAVNGIMKYTIVADDLDTVGLHQIQGYVVVTGWTGHTSIETFYVEANL